VFELEVYDSSGVNVAPFEVASQSSTFKNSTKFAASNAIDSDNTTFSHTNDASAWLQVDLSSAVDVARVSIANRWCGDESDSTGCICRLSSASLTLLDVNGDVIGTKSLGNTCNVLTVSEEFSLCSSGTLAPSSAPTTKNWDSQKKLIASNVTAEEGYGYGYSVSVYGDVAVIGAPDDDSVYVFTRDAVSGNWTESAKLEIGTVDAFGFSVSISNDVIVVGASDDSAEVSYSGSAYIFQE
jgi:hypothetical protein